MIAGFTGTRQGLTRQQKDYVEYLLNEHDITKVIHGDCLGADSDIHDIALDLSTLIEIRPCNLKNQRAFRKEGNILEPKDPLSINHSTCDSVGSEH